MKVVIKRSDDNVSVMSLLGDAAEAALLAPEQIEVFVEAELAQWTKEQREDVVSWRVMPDDAIPADRTFRSAWRDASEALVIDHDMEKCREIWRDKMRVARAPKLTALDIEFQKALEEGKSTADVAQAKRSLRDVTSDSAIEAATTPEELKAVWPDILSG